MKTLNQPFWPRLAHRLRDDRGSALLDTIVALGLSAFVLTKISGYITITDIIPSITTARAERVASFTAASERYVATYRDAIDAAIVGAGGVSQVVTPTMMQAAGSLPAGYNDGGLAPVLVIRRDAVLGQLDPFVAVTGRQFDDVEVASIAKELRKRNVDGGGITTGSPTRIAFSSWQKNVANYADSGLALPVGTVAASLRLQDGTTSNALSRTRVDSQPELNRMETALDMGNHDITGARAVVATAGITAGGNIETSGYLRSTRVVTAGDSCSATEDVGGLVRDSSGKPLYCDLATASFQTAGGGGGGTFRVWVSFHQQNFGTFCPNSICPAPCPPGASEIYPKHWDGSGVLYTTTYIPEAFGWMWEAERWCKLD